MRRFEVYFVNVLTCESRVPAERRAAHFPIKTPTLIAPLASAGLCNL